MNRVLSPEIKSQLAKSGAAMTQVPSGIPRVRYYTPDGREEWKIPQHRTRGDGLIYDVFLAQGYTLTPPENSKPHCDGCDRWHDTQEEVDACIEEKKSFMAKMNRKATQELAKEQVGKDKEIIKLKDKVDKLTKLLEEKLGKEI